MILKPLKQALFIILKKATVITNTVNLPMKKLLNILAEWKAKKTEKTFGAINCIYIVGILPKANG